jgi:hypothetical protein
MGTRRISGVNITVRLSGSLQNVLDDLSSVSVVQPSLNYSQSLSTGVGSGQANRSWQQSGTLADGAQVTLDLHDMVGIDLGAGAGLDALGQAINFDDLMTVLILNDNEVALPGRLEVLPASSEGWLPIGEHTLANGGALLGQGMLLKTQPNEAGFTVSPAASSHRLTLRASGGPVDYYVGLLARDKTNP